MNKNEIHTEFHENGKKKSEGIMENGFIKTIVEY